MDLSTYITNLSRAERQAFAERCGLNRHYLWSIARRWRAAGGRALVVIERESGGAVTARDLRPDLFGGQLELRKPGGGTITRGRAA